MNAAVSTLPQNEEWSLMARSAIDQYAGQNFLRGKISDASALDLEKRILAITAQGQNPRTWSKQNFVSSLLSKFDGNQIGDSNLLNDDIFGLLALSSAGESGDVINKIRAHILANQNSDGGWGFSRGGSSDSNTTAMTVAALRASGGNAPGNAISYLKNTQNQDGGYGYTPSSESDGASTAWVIIGLRSAGASVPQNSINYLESLQLQDGSFKWMNSSSGSSLVTAYAVIALSGKSMPIRSIAASPTPTPSPNPAPNPTPTNPNPQTPTVHTPPPAAPTLPVNDSQCVSITAPNQVQTNQTFVSTVVFVNTGTKTWVIDENPHLLGSQNPQDNVLWGTARVNLPGNINPGASAGFSFTAKAPSTPGLHQFSWRMVEEHVQWFGDLCTKAITVSAPAPPPPAPVQAPSPPQPGNSTFYVTISYPGNKIYVGKTSFSSVNFTASNGQQYSYNTPRAIGTLVNAAKEINLLYEIKGLGLGPFVHTINGYAPLGSSGWQYAVNGTAPTASSADYVLKSGDVVQWFYGPPNTLPY